MIWQLVKRDPGWRHALIYAAVSGVACPIVPREFLGMFGVLVAMCWFQTQPHERATLFQAGLPIRSGDLVLVRILLLFAGVWLPVACGAALMLLAEGSSLSSRSMVSPIIRLSIRWKSLIMV